MECQMRDCHCFDCNLGVKGSCSILVGACDYPFLVGVVYEFEFKKSKTYRLTLDGQYKFLGNLDNGKISIKHVASRIEFHVPRTYIQSVTSTHSQEFD